MVLQHPLPSHKWQLLAQLSSAPETLHAYLTSCMNEKATLNRPKTQPILLLNKKTWKKSGAQSKVSHSPAAGELMGPHGPQYPDEAYWGLHCHRSPLSHLGHWQQHQALRSKHISNWNSTPCFQLPSNDSSQQALSIAAQSISESTTTHHCW